MKVKTVARTKMMMDRAKNYGTWVNMFILMFLFIDRVGFNWWYLLIIPVAVIIMYLDQKYIMPAEFGVLFKLGNREKDK